TLLGPSMSPLRWDGLARSVFPKRWGFPERPQRVSSYDPASKPCEPSATLGHSESFYRVSYPCECCRWLRPHVSRLLPGDLVSSTVHRANCVSVQGHLPISKNFLRANGGRPCGTCLPLRHSHLVPSSPRPNYARPRCGSANSCR